MKRNKKWWANFTNDERNFIWYYERAINKISHRSPFLPDDSYSCPMCGNPYSGKDTCDCSKRYSVLINSEI